MTLESGQSRDNIQKLVGMYERKIGITRYTKDTISEGPVALMQRAFSVTITQFVDSMEIFYSLDSAFRTAVMTISDPVSFRATLPITGHEIVTVSYSNALSSSETKQKIIHFIIHNITEDIDSSSTSLIKKKLTLKLVEFPAFELLLSKQVYKTYPIDENNTPKLRFSDIVKDMLNNIKYFSDWYDIDIENSTENAVNFYVPNWLPMKVINYCKKFAVSEKKKYPMYIFNIGNKSDSDKPVACFKPVYSFIDDANKYRSYGHTFREVFNDDNNQRAVYSPVDTILEHHFEYYNSQNIGIMSGETNVSFDYLNDNKYLANDYDNYLKTIHKGLNTYPLYPFSHGNQWSSIKRSPWNYQEAKVNVKNEMVNEYSTNILKNGVKCKCMSYVFEARECGERAELIFNVNGNDKIYDKMMSGAWITWSITDVFMGGNAFSTIYFYNDGFVNISDPSQTFNKINTITGDKAPDKIK